MTTQIFAHKATKFGANNKPISEDSTKMTSEAKLSWEAKSFLIPKTKRPNAKRDVNIAAGAGCFHDYAPFLWCSRRGGGCGPCPGGRGPA